MSVLDYVSINGARYDLQDTRAQEMIASAEASSTSSAARPAGSYFIHHGVLYKAEADIAAGDAIAPGVNCSEKPSGLGGEMSGLKRGLLQLAETGNYVESTEDVYCGLTEGMIAYTTTKDIDQLIQDRNYCGYIILPKARMQPAYYFDDSNYKVNYGFYKNNREISGTYTSWITESPVTHTPPQADYDGIFINVQKLNASSVYSEYDFAHTLYYKRTRNQVGNLATIDYVDAKTSGMKGSPCIYPDGFTSRIKPDIYRNGRFIADIDTEDYKIDGPGEVWVASDG